MGLCLFAGCGSSDKEKVSPTAKQLVGEWQLKTWTGETPQDFDIYLSFGADNTFEIYQRLAEVKYQKFTGSYQVQNDVLRRKIQRRQELRKHLRHFIQRIGQHADADQPPRTLRK